MSNDRISKLGQRFSRTPSKSSADSSEKPNRTRRTFYLEADLIKQLDSTFKTVSHELYPHDIEKSAFLEAVIRHGLDNLEEIKTVLASSQ